MPRVAFEVSCETQWGDCVVVAGANEQFGNWSPASSKLKLCTEEDSYPRWRGSLHVQPGEKLHFKFAVLRPCGGVRWEDSILDRELIVSDGCLTLQAVFDRSGVALLSQPMPQLSFGDNADVKLSVLLADVKPPVPNAHVKLTAPEADVKLPVPCIRRSCVVEESTWPLFEVILQAASKLEADMHIRPSDVEENLQEESLQQQPQPAVEDAMWQNLEEGADYAAFKAADDDLLTAAAADTSFSRTASPGSDCTVVKHTCSEVVSEAESDEVSTACPSPKRLLSEGDDHLCCCAPFGPPPHGLEELPEPTVEVRAAIPETWMSRSFQCRARDRHYVRA